RPRQDEWRFDPSRGVDSVVGLRAEIPEDAFTAQILGTERAGSGVVIRDDGLVLTIGYLITEASTIWITTNKGTVAGGFPLAYDQVTGFGLVHPLGKLGVKPIERGSANSCRVGENVVMAGHGGAARRRRAGARRTGGESRTAGRRRDPRRRRRQAREPGRALPPHLGLRQCRLQGAATRAPRDGDQGVPAQVRRPQRLPEEAAPALNRGQGGN